MARNQARPNRLIRNEDGTFGTNWGYKMDSQPIEFALEPEFWNSCRGNLLAGDTIRIVEMKKFDGNPRVTASCTMIVMGKDERKVDMELYEGKEIYRYEIPHEVSVDESKVSAEADFAVKEQYVEETANIEKPADGDYQVKTAKGVVAEVPTLGEAQQIARGDKAIPPHFMS